MRSAVRLGLPQYKTEEEEMAVVWLGSCKHV
jgi:hypothetical protein